MRKKLISLITTVLIFLGLGFYYLESNFGINSNAFEVYMEGELQARNLKIYKGENLKVSSDLRHKIIYDEGRKSLLENDYGENDFLFVYSDSLCCMIRHFKTNDKQVDKYDFRIMKERNRLIVWFKVRGTDNFSVKKELIKCYD